MNYRESVFECLPKSKTTSFADKELLIKELEEQLYRKSSVEDNDASVRLIKSIINRLQSKDPEFSWEQKQFANFRKKISIIDERNLRFCLNSLLELLDASNSEILMELKFVSDNFEQYPGLERVKEESTGLYYVREKEMELFDCFYLLRLLFTTMKSHVNFDSKRLLEAAVSYDVASDYVLEVMHSDNIEMKESFFKGFDNRFGFLNQSKFYKDMYIQFKSSYCLEVLSELRKMYGQKKLIEEKNLPKGKSEKAYQSYLNELKRERDAKRRGF